MNKEELMYLEDIEMRIYVNSCYLYIYTRHSLFNNEKSAFLKRAIIYALEEFLLNHEELDKEIIIKDEYKYFGICIEYDT